MNIGVNHISLPFGLRQISANEDHRFIHFIHSPFFSQPIVCHLPLVIKMTTGTIIISASRAGVLFYSPMMLPGGGAPDRCLSAAVALTCHSNSLSPLKVESGTTRPHCALTETGFKCPNLSFCISARKHFPILCWQLSCKHNRQALFSKEIQAQIESRSFVLKTCTWHKAVQEVNLIISMKTKNPWLHWAGWRTLYMSACKEMLQSSTQGGEENFPNPAGNHLPEMHQTFFMAEKWKRH